MSVKHLLSSYCKVFNYSDCMITSDGIFDICTSYFCRNQANNPYEPLLLMCKINLSLLYSFFKILKSCRSFF